MSSGAAHSGEVERSRELGRSLRSHIRGEVLFRESPGFRDASVVWNGMVQRTPGVIVRCAGISDVQRAVRAAQHAELATAVRCGGHSLAGFSTCEGGVIIDLSLMRNVAVDEARRTARAAGGCLLGTIDSATQRFGLVFPAGVVSHTGASGLILGGGTGWLTRHFGLSCDNVLGFQLVLFDGSVVEANEHQNADLFWALRGGGGNFGVVTEFHLKLHSLKSVLLASAWCPEDEIGTVLRFWRDFMPDAPEELKWNISLAKAPDSPALPAPMRGRPALTETVIWTGDADSGQRYLRAALQTGNPVVTCNRELQYLELQTMADSEFPHGGRYYTKSGYFRELQDISIEIMIESLASMPSPKSQIELAYLGGACGRVAADATAFGDRSAPFVLNLLGQWNHPAEDEANVAWVRNVFAELRPHMTPGVYVNFMSGDEDDRVPEAYRTRWERLLRIKQACDPGNFFRRNQNIVRTRARLSVV